MREIANLTYDLYVIKLQSPKLYHIIVDYYIKHSFDERSLLGLGNRVAVNFLHSLAFCHPNLQSVEMFAVMRKYMMVNMDRFNRFQLIKLLDIYKYNQAFMQEPASQRLK